MTNRIQALALAGLTAIAASAGTVAITGTPEHIEARSITLVNNDGPVLTFGLSGNNEGRGTPVGQRIARLHVAWHGDYPAETEIEPGPESQPIGNIANQIMLWGPRTRDGTGRPRLTTQLVVDGDGGLEAVIDATTNDRRGRVPPLVLSAAELYFLVLHPGDGTLELQDRTKRLPGDTSQWLRIRRPIADVIAALEQ